MRILKLSFQTQVYALQSLIIITIIYLCALLWLYVEFDLDTFKLLLLLLLSLLYLIVFFLPVIILHMNYINISVKEIRLDNNQLIIKGQKITEAQIKSIDTYATYQHYHGSWGITLPYNDFYYHMYLYLCDGRVFILTSLLGYNLDRNIAENFPNIHINKNIMFYPYI